MRFSLGTRSLGYLAKIQTPPSDKVRIYSSGKSSLVQLFFGLVSQTSGSVHIDGVDLDTVPREVIRQRVVGLPQQSFCSSLGTIRRNLDPERRHSDTDITEMMRRVFVGISEQPEFDLDWAWEDCHFSPGLQQRMAIARTLLREATIYVMDEPTSG